MLSVIVIAKNEQERIRACLESVKWADEIIFLDNDSSDKTLKIARGYTDKIYIFKDLGFATLRNKAMEKAVGQWVLYVDSDERVLSSLRKEVEDIIKVDGISALAISRRNIIFGKEVNYGPFWPDWVIRLFKKEELEGWVGEVHEQPEFKGKLGYSKNSLLHLTHRGVDQIVLKSLEWSKIEARLRFNSKHPKMSAWRFLRIVITESFIQGILRKGFFNGTVGIMDSMLQTFSMFITYVRLWQMQQGKPINKVYEEIDKDLMESGFKDN